MLTLAGCNTPYDQTQGAIGGGLIGALAGDSSNAALAGAAIGILTANPCKTRESGVVISNGYSQSQQQRTSYNCDRPGRPSGARAPVFQ